jgi:DNA-binding MarR family transcriptional regulator
MAGRRSERAELMAALNRAMREASGQGVLFSQAVAERLGLTSSDLECLDLLMLRGPVTAGELAQWTGLTTGAVTGIIDRLETAGFVQRERDLTDRRKVVVRPLAAVHEKIVPLYAPMQEAADAALSGYSNEELALMLDFFTRAHEAAVKATTILRGEGQLSRGGPRRRIRRGGA